MGGKRRGETIFRRRGSNLLVTPPLLPPPPVAALAAVDVGLRRSERQRRMVFNESASAFECNSYVSREITNKLKKFQRQLNAVERRGGTTPCSMPTFEHCFQSFGRDAPGRFSPFPSRRPRSHQVIDATGDGVVGVLPVSPLPRNSLLTADVLAAAGRAAAGLTRRTVADNWPSTHPPGRPPRQRPPRYISARVTAIGRTSSWRRYVRDHSVNGTSTRRPSPVNGTRSRPRRFPSRTARPSADR